jgi:hypothetical protein
MPIQHAIDKATTQIEEINRNMKQAYEPWIKSVTFPSLETDKVLQKSAKNKYSCRFRQVW